MAAAVLPALTQAVVTSLSEETLVGADEVCRLRVSYGGKFVQVRSCELAFLLCCACRCPTSRPSDAPPRWSFGLSGLERRSQSVITLSNVCCVVPWPPPPLPAWLLLLAQDAGGQWRYQGGESHLESIPTTWRYADLMHRLAERCNGAVALKYFEPNDEMHPDNLLTVSDDDDLKVRTRPAAGSCLPLVVCSKPFAPFSGQPWWHQWRTCWYLN